MQPIQRLLGPLGTLLILFLLVGCGLTPPSGTTDLPPTTPTRAPSTSPGIPTPSARTGSVTLHVERSLYQISESISVTVNNQSHQTITFPDHLTNCTVILLQRQKAQPQTSDTGQTGINPCLAKTATRTHTLPSGQHLVVPLVPPKSGWPVGFYLATLSYHTAATAGSSPTIASVAFVVSPLGTQP